MFTCEEAPTHWWLRPKETDLNNNLNKPSVYEKKKLAVSLTATTGRRSQSVLTPCMCKQMPSWLCSGKQNRLLNCGNRDRCILAMWCYEAQRGSSNFNYRAIKGIKEKQPQSRQLLPQVAHLRTYPAAKQPRMQVLARNKPREDCRASPHACMHAGSNTGKNPIYTTLHRTCLLRCTAPSSSL